MNAAGKTPAGGASTGSPPKPARNPMERIVVWGGIIVLVLIALIEYRAKTGFEASLKALEDAANDITKDVTYADAQGMMTGYTSMVGPTEDQGHQTHDYKWFSLFKGGTYNIKLVASRDQEPTLLTFVTPLSDQEIAEEKARIAAAEAAFAAEPSREGIEPTRGGGGEGGGAGGPGGPGGFGGGGRGAFPNPVRDALDADTDGALSAEELAAASTALAKLDANGDGAVAAEELTPPAPEGGDGPRPGRGPGRLVQAIDTNEDGNISAEELAAAGASLAKLDADGDGALSGDEMRPPRGAGGPGGPGGPGGERPRRPEVESSPAAETPAPAAEAPAPAAESTPAAETPAPAAEAAPPAAEPAAPAETAPATPAETPAAPAEATTPNSAPANP